MYYYMYSMYMYIPMLTDHFTDQKFKVLPSLSLRLLFWSCKEDCSYSCAWKTVDYFTSHGLTVPQFHGKVYDI